MSMDPKYPLISYPVDWSAYEFGFGMQNTGGSQVDLATITLDATAAHGFANDSAGLAESGSLLDNIRDNIIADFAASSPTYYGVASIVATYVTGRDVAHPQWTLEITTTGDPDILLVTTSGGDELEDIGLRPAVATTYYAAVKTGTNAFTITSNGNARGWFCPNRPAGRIEDHRTAHTRRRTSGFDPSAHVHVLLGLATTFDIRWGTVDGFYITDRKHAKPVYAGRAGLYGLVTEMDQHNTLEELIEALAVTPEARLYLDAGEYVTVRLQDNAELDTGQVSTPVSAGGTMYTVTLPLVVTS